VNGLKHIGDRDMKNKKYVIACMGCGETKGLVQYAHRNKNKNIVGFLYSCEKCTKALEGQDIRIDLSRVGLKAKT